MFQRLDAGSKRGGGGADFPPLPPSPSHYPPASYLHPLYPFPLLFTLPFQADAVPRFMVL